MPPTALALTFLSPLAGVLAGAIAGPILLSLYFLRLRRRALRVSSTLLWERAVQDLQVNAPFRWIRPSWLLLLQALILALLCVAAARPAIDLPAVEGGRVILLIDRSASMSATDAEGGSRLDDAKREAIDLVGRLSGGGTRFMVVAYAARARTVASFTADTGALGAAIRAIEPTDQPARVDEAARVVNAFATRSEAESGEPPRVVLLSDGGAASASGPPVALAGAEVEFVRVGPEPGAEGENIGIVAMSARRDFDDPALVRVFVRLRSNAADPRSVSLVLSLDGEAQGADTIDVPGRGPDGAPGEAARTYSLRNTTGGVLVGTLGRPDALASDDDAGLVLSRPLGPSIMVVRPGAARTVGETELIRALEFAEPRALRDVTRAEYTERAGSPGFFEGVDLVVYHGVRPESLPPAPSLSFDATLPIPGLGVIDAEPGDAPFTVWTRSHPLMAYMPLDRSVVRSPRRIELPAPDSGATTETLAWTRAGPAIVEIEADGLRRVVVAFDVDRSRWYEDWSLRVFAQNAVDTLALGAARLSGDAWTTAEPVAVNAGDDPGPFRLTGPGGASREARPDPTGRVALGLLPRAGLYRLEGGGGSRTIAANLFDPSETLIRTSDRVDLAGREARATPVSGLAPRELWPYAVAAALALLVLEWFVFAAKIRI